MWPLASFRMEIFVLPHTRMYLLPSTSLADSDFSLVPRPHPTHSGPGTRVNSPLNADESIGPYSPYLPVYSIVFPRGFLCCRMDQRIINADR